MPDSSPPTNEIGVGTLGVGTWNSYADENEFVPALAWPESINTYTRMRRDAQIASLEEAVLLPILSRRWRIDPNGADDRIVQFFSQDLGIPVMGQKDDIDRPRAKGRFRFRDHIRMAMTYRSFGHAYFEQVCPLGEDGLYHLKKLAPRWQSSIQEISMNQTGGLDFIRQYAGKPQNMGGFWIGSGGTSKPISVDRLVAYINRQEGDWFGQSILRPLYKHYVRKDRLLRVDAIKHERNGMGVPIVEAPANATKEQMLQAQALTTAYRAGEAAGGTLPEGFKLRLVGVEGSIPDTLASLRYDDEQMSRVYLAMFMQLGQTQSGSRALGESFTDFFSLSLDAICDDLVSVFNEHVIEDLVDWNWGPDNPAPLLTYDTSEDKILEASDFVDFVNAGVISLSDDDEDWVRSEWELPERDTDAVRTKTANENADGTPVQTPPTPPDPNADPAVDPATEDKATTTNALVGERGTELIDVRADTKVVPNNLLRPQNREVNEHEIAAGTDFVAMEAAINDAVSFLVTQWNATVKPAQIESLTTQIEQAGEDLVALALINAPVLGDDILKQELDRVVSHASALAVKEAATQGVEIAPLSPNDFADALNQKSTAMATVMAKSLSETAGRHAITNFAPDVSAGELATLVKDHLNSLTDAYLNDTLGSTVHGAHNDGRFATLDQGDVKNFYASELLDGHACGPCSRVNNTKYKTLEEMLKDYGAGFYKLCKGGPLCRGTAVAIFKTEVKPSK